MRQNPYKHLIERAAELGRKIVTVQSQIGRLCGIVLDHQTTLSHPLRTRSSSMDRAQHETAQQYLPLRKQELDEARAEMARLVAERDQVEAEMQEP